MVCELEEGGVTFYTAADMAAQKDAAYAEAKRYCERLERENERLREALRRISDYTRSDFVDWGESKARVAREALNG